MLGLQSDNGTHRNVRNHLQSDTAWHTKACDWIILNAATRNSNPEMSLFSPSYKRPYYAESCYNGQLCRVDSASIWCKFYGCLQEQSITFRNTFFEFHLSKLFSTTKLISPSRNLQWEILMNFCMKTVKICVQCRCFRDYFRKHFVVVVT